ncbi:MAG: hypothetical protein Kow00105_11670 [Phycisphaeraceae bacterium]
MRFDRDGTVCAPLLTARRADILAPMTDRLEQLHKLHTADPNDADVTYMIAMEHAKQGDHASVIDWLNKTLTLDSNYLYAYFQLGKAYSALGQDEQAKTALQRGIEKANAVGDPKAISELNELLASIS